MPPVKHFVTRLSTTGRIVLPKAIRHRRQWAGGTLLVVEETAEGVLLKAAPVVPQTKPEEVFGSLSSLHKAKTIEEMNAGIIAEARRRFNRS